MFVHKYKRQSWLNISENMMVVQSFSPPVCSSPSHLDFWMKRSPTGLLKDFREENWMKRSPTSRNSEEVVGRKGRWSWVLSLLSYTRRWFSGWNIHLGKSWIGCQAISLPQVWGTSHLHCGEVHGWGCDEAATVLNISKVLDGGHHHISGGILSWLVSSGMGSCPSEQPG